MSFIRARDPSIQNFNRNNLRRVNLQFSVNKTFESKPSDEEPSISCEEIGIPIYLRVKPSSTNSEDYVIHENQLLYGTNTKESTYKRITFSEIFDVNSKQGQFFDEVVKYRLFNFLSGENTTLFTYGAPSAGRTYSCIGTEKDPGFLPRSLEYIFKTLPKFPDVSPIKPTPEGQVITLNPHQIQSEQALKTTILKSQKARNKSDTIKTYRAMEDRLKDEAFASMEETLGVSIGIWVSFVEIFNEEFYDLLSPMSGDTKLRLVTPDGQPFLKDATYLSVSNGLEAFQIYQYGIQKMECSKRTSHSIFTIKLATSKNNEETTFISTFNICNLCGVDEAKRDDDKIKFKASNSIRNSLMVLGICLNRLEHFLKDTRVKQIIPCRDSKLTELFQRALNGFEDFCVILHINFSKNLLHETQNILNFSGLEKSVVPKETFMHHLSSKQASQLRHNSEVDEQLKLLQETLKEVNSAINELETNGDNILREEEEALKKGWEEIFRDHEKMFKNQENNLKQICERKYETRLSRLKFIMKTKVEEKNKRALQQKKALKETIKLNEQILKDQNLEIAQLEETLQKLEDLQTGIENQEQITSEKEGTLNDST